MAYIYKERKEVVIGAFSLYGVGEVEVDGISYGVCGCMPFPTANPLRQRTVRYPSETVEIAAISQEMKGFVSLNTITQPDNLHLSTKDQFGRIIYLSLSSILEKSGVTFDGVDTYDDNYDKLMFTLPGFRVFSDENGAGKIGDYLIDPTQITTLIIAQK